MPRQYSTTRLLLTFVLFLGAAGTLHACRTSNSEHSAAPGVVMEGTNAFITVDNAAEFRGHYTLLRSLHSDPLPDFSEIIRSENPPLLWRYAVDVSKDGTWGEVEACKIMLELGYGSYSDRSRDGPRALDIANRISSFTCIEKNLVIADLRFGKDSPDYDPKQYRRLIQKTALLLFYHFTSDGSSRDDKAPATPTATLEPLRDQLPQQLREFFDEALSLRSRVMLQVEEKSGCALLRHALSYWKGFPDTYRDAEIGELLLDRADRQLWKNLDSAYAMLVVRPYRRRNSRINSGGGASVDPFFEFSNRMFDTYSLRDLADKGHPDLSWKFGGYAAVRGNFEEALQRYQTSVLAGHDYLTDRLEAFKEKVPASKHAEIYRRAKQANETYAADSCGPQD